MPEQPDAATQFPVPHADDVSTGWMWLGALMPIGFRAWVPLVAGYRARHRGWILTGIGILAFAIFAFAFSSAEESNDFGGGFLMLAWVMAGATSFALRRPYERRMALQSGYDDQIALAEHISGERRAMTALAARDPARAAGLGVGRPDLPGSRHGHLVDLNHAPAHVTAGLPGVNKDLAIEIVALREELGCFDSVEDVGALMSLHPRVVEALRTRAVALPD